MSLLRTDQRLSTQIFLTKHAQGPITSGHSYRQSSKKTRSRVGGRSESRRHLHRQSRQDLAERHRIHSRPYRSAPTSAGVGKRSRQQTSKVTQSHRRLQRAQNNPHAHTHTLAITHTHSPSHDLSHWLELNKRPNSCKRWARVTSSTRTPSRGILVSNIPVEVPFAKRRPWGLSE